MFYNTKLVIKGLEIKTGIGIYDWEKAIKQTIILDLEFNIQNNLSKNSTINNIDDTINYASVTKLLTETIANKNFLLIEELGVFIMHFLKEKFSHEPTLVRVHKPHAVRNAEDIYCEICSE